MAARNTESLHLNQDVLDAHQQRSQMTCLPMAVEFVLKLLGKIAPGAFELQDAWIDGRRDFREFDGKVIQGSGLNRITLRRIVATIFRSKNFSLQSSRNSELGDM